MAVDNSANNALLVSRTSSGEAFGDALRLYVGRGRRYSVKVLSNATGVPDRIIECAMVSPETTDYRSPNLETTLSLAKFLGPEFTSAWLERAEQGAFWLPDANEVSPSELAAELAEDNAKVARAAADNEFDRGEKRNLRPVGRHLMAVGAALAANAA